MCAINLGQVADEGSATSYKVRPPLFTATYLQFYNKSSQAVRDNCWSMWEAAAWAKDRQHLGPLTALTTCCSTYSRYFTTSALSVTASPIFVPTHGCVTRPPITFPPLLPNFSPYCRFRATRGEGVATLSPAPQRHDWRKH